MRYPYATQKDLQEVGAIYNTLSPDTKYMIEQLYHHSGRAKVLTKDMNIFERVREMLPGSMTLAENSVEYEELVENGLVVVSSDNTGTTIELNKLGVIIAGKLIGR